MPFSPPQSVASSSGSSSPLTIKKLVLDGKSKSEGASFRMSLKVSVCIDNVQPGALFPLFPENNTRIHAAEVHPLDDRFSPYSFSPDERTLIEKGASSLQLPPMISKTYMSLFHANDPDTSRRHRGMDPVHYSAQVLVTAYTITLVLPKEFPPLSRNDTGDSEGDETLRYSHPRSARKQSSIFSRNHLNYIVACELLLPFLSTPPRGPFLISIPVPRCLDNQLRMRIAVPPDSVARPTRHSGDSTSSGDDTAGWDFLTDPPVTRRVSRFGARNGDEDHPSDHTTVTSGVEVIQGAFQSTDCLHIRWAPPLPRRSRPENGMWRVNMQTSAAVMKCQVLARNETTVRMGISYEAKCSELWHPGVATMVGLDAVLDAKRRTILWPEEEHLKGWLVTVREEAFVGIHRDTPQAVSRHSSVESTFSSTFLPTLNQDSMLIPRGSASLLQAPLPSNNPPDYSFENSSPNGSPRHQRTMSADRGLTKDSLRTFKDSPPNAPVTLKINMHKLLRSARNEFSFIFRGVILIRLDPEAPEDFIPLPKFNVLGIHTQEVKTWVSMHIAEDIFLDDEHPSEQGRRQLITGKDVQCEEETVLIVPRSRSLVAASRNPGLSPNIGSANDSPSPSRKVSRLSRLARNSPFAARPPVPKSPPVEQTPDAAYPVASTPSSHFKTLALAHVEVSVTPLDRSLTRDRCSHRVKVTLPVHAVDSDTIQFGLATTKIPNSKPVSPHVDLLCASYWGRQIPANIHKVVDSELELTASITTNQPNTQLFGEMQYSVSIDTSGIQPGLGTIDCVYLVDFPGTETHGNERQAATNDKDLDALLPCFHVPVLMYEVSIDSVTKNSYSLKSTTFNRDSPYASKFAQYYVPAEFYPCLHISLYPSSPHGWWRLKTFLYILGFTVFILPFSQLIWVRRDLQDVRSSMNAILYGLMNGGDPRSFLEGYYATNERNRDASEDWRYRENPVIFVSTVTTTLTVTQTQTSYTLAPTLENDREDDSIRTIRLSEADTLMQPPRTTLARSPPPPATSRDTAGGDIRALVQLHALSLQSFKFPFPNETKLVVKKFMKLMYFLRRVWNFPMDPD